MRIFKSFIGWLCFLSLIDFVFFTGYWVYSLGLPFFHGTALYKFSEPNTLKMARAIGERGITADNGALLRDYTKRREPPIVKLTGWDAVGWIIDHGHMPKADRSSGISVIAVLDEQGQVVSAYPPSLVGEVFPFRIPIRDLQDSVRTEAGGHTQFWPANYRYPVWSENFINTAKAFNPNVGAVYMNRIVSPQGHTIGVLAVASPRDLVTLYQPSEPFHWWSTEETRNLAIAWFLLYLILLPVWTGLDAGWRGMRPFAWGILVALTGWIGLLAYLIARLPAPGTCYNCGEKILGKYVRCPSCGVTLSNRCPVCRRKMKPGWQYCPTCRDIQPEPVDVSPTPVQPETTQPASTTSPDLRVTVLDAESSAPLQNARLIVKGPSNLDGITNNAGVFHARKLRAGGYVVTAMKQGFESATAELDMGATASEACKLMLRALPSGISGRVIRRPDQQPVPGAKVYLDSSRLDRSTETGADGCFMLDDIPAGPYTVRADAEGFESQTRLAQVAPGQPVTLDFALNPTEEQSNG